MADDEIISKLARYTYMYPEDEAAVVYLIIQIGKIIERQSISEDYPVLWFYRNWVVHSKLDRDGRDARTEMLDKLNEAVLATIAKKSSEILQQFERAISLNSLHKEIVRFVRKHHLERPDFDYLPWFKNFDTLLVSILVDLPLMPPTDSGYAFTEFKFKKSNTEQPEVEFEILVLKSANGGIPLSINGKLRA